jgi:hypothetical protein
MLETGLKRDPDSPTIYPNLPIYLARFEGTNPMQSVRNVVNVVIMFVLLAFIASSLFRLGVFFLSGVLSVS